MYRVYVAEVSYLNQLLLSMHCMLCRNSVSLRNHPDDPDEVWSKPSKFLSSCTKKEQFLLYTQLRHISGSQNTARAPGARKNRSGLTGMRGKKLLISDAQPVNPIGFRACAAGSTGMDHSEVGGKKNLCDGIVRRSSKV